MDYLARQKKALAAIADKHEALLATHLSNVRYLTGFSGSAGVLVVSTRGTVLFTDGRYQEQAKTEARGTRVVITAGSAVAAAAQWMAGHRVRAVAIEAEHTTVALRAALRSMIPRSLKIRETQGLVEELRMIKDANELQRIRNAVRLGSSLLDTALGVIRPGASEIEVAAEMEYDARQKGAESMSFPTIVASGARSALPHGRASTAAIARGFVVLDFGVILAGYCSDKTRTVYVGKPTAQERRMYEAVREAQQAAIDSVRAGVIAGEVDFAARSVLRRAKLDRYFTHSTGHGVGLEIHEAPRLARGQPDVLRSGMVITLEPGVYIPSKGGVRIEDMVIVTERGCDVLCPTQKELITL
ncbi:MAG TPA: aminopeptidase P family protein [Terriglobales bacterium]|nr:aminopeptidase P family protein [Terriglobales bacterium]